MTRRRSQWLSTGILGIALLWSGAALGQLESLEDGVLSMDQVVQNARTFRNHMMGGGRQYALGAKAGVLLELGNRGHSGFRVYLSGGLTKNFSQGDWGALLNYQVDLVLFSNGMGASILPSQRSRVNFEIRNHIGIAVGGNDCPDCVWGRPLNANVGDATSVFDDPMDYDIQIGTVFVNGLNHKRHQQLGFLSGGAGPFHIYYMNDGPPYGAFGLGDPWDRYWTGGGGMGFHWIDKNSEVTSFELRYSRYTGDEPYVYDLSSDLRMNYLPHKNDRVQFLTRVAISTAWASEISPLQG
jgi:hypothetical protein